MAIPLCLGNISKNFATAYMKIPGLIASVFKFSVDYDDIAVSDILDIHKDLMKKNGIK